MRKHGFNASALHGDMDQHSRLQTLDAFRSGSLDILIASDVAARGLDIPAVSHVFNFDVPVHAEDYVHRIGRTGRAGREGFAFMLVTRHETKQLAAIQKLIRKDIDWEGAPMTEAAEPAGMDAPSERRGRGRDGRSKNGRDGGRTGGRGSHRERPAAEAPVAAAPVAAAPVAVAPAVAAAAVAAPVREEASPRPQRNEERHRRNSNGRHRDHEIGAIEGALNFQEQEIPAFLARPVR